MKGQACRSCEAEIEAWRERCVGCGGAVETDDAQRRRARALRVPSLGALLFTQGWALGARLYGWFVLSLVPVVGFGVLAVLVVFGRRLSWKRGAWADWDEFQARMRLLDALAVLWIVGLAAVWLVLRGRA